MNEYRGFKIGDKVEVLYSDKTTMITGTIEKFGDRNLGGCMEPDTMKVDIRESVNGSIYQLDMIHMVSHELIKKLPTYSLGDKVSVNIEGYDLGEGKICYISGLPDIYHVRTEEHCVVTVSSKELKKLPKYKVGDVVRVKSFEQIKREFPKLETPDGVAFYIGNDKWDMSKFCGKVVTLKPHKCEGLLTIEEGDVGHNWPDEFLEPFDGFRIGDTVWTAKRGKGKIVDKTIFCQDPDRPFIVRFEGESKDRCPKLYSMYPTEKKMIESLPKMECHTYSWGFSMEPGFSLPFLEPKPKFKVGDVVFYNSPSGVRKWTVDIVWNPKSGLKYGLKGFKGDKLFNVAVTESDLRLWKETVLTHCLQSDGVTWSEGGCGGWKTEWYKKIEHLSAYKNPDLFKVTTHGGVECIFRGIKGDDL